MALHRVVQKVEKAFLDKELALGIYFDVEGAFEKANTGTICSALEARGVTSALVDWLFSLLGDSTAEAGMGDHRLSIRVRGGCPSPHLWCLVMNDLLARLRSSGFYAQAYAYDGSPCRIAIWTSSVNA